MASPPEPAAAWTALVLLARRAGFAVQRADCAGGEGFTTWRNRLIRIRVEATPEQAVTALAHQLGHVLLHGRIARLEPSGTVPCQGSRKVEADSVAFLVGSHLGMRPETITFPGVASWAGTDPRAHPEATATMVAERVVGAAGRIIARLDEVLPPARTLPGAATAIEPDAGPERHAVPGGEVVPGQSHLPLGGTAPAPVDGLVRVNDDAARFFQARLAGSWVPGYLAGRGFGAETLARWQAGYAPAGWSSLVSHLHEIGYRDELIEAAGLARRSARGTLVDIFRDRAMLPIRSADGTVVAFIGRAAEGAGAGVPKYLNSPGSGLYDKGGVLFGLWEAREALARGARPVIVEGPLDAVAVSVAGGDRHAGVAPCGTALTARQVTALDRLAGLGGTGVLVAFDDDQAGRRAAVRAYHLLTPVTGEVLAAVLPPGQDPAQVLECQGPAALAATLAAHTRPLADLVVDAELDRWSRWLRHAEGRISALRTAAPLIAAMPVTDVARQVARVADRLELDYATVTDAVTDALPDVIARASAGQKLRGPPGGAPYPARRDFPSDARKGLSEGAAGSGRSGAARNPPARLPGRRVPR